MAITEATKVADSIKYTEDGKVTVKTITGTHIVISFPIDGYNEVLNVYVDPDTEILTVAYDGGSFDIDPTAVSDHGSLTGVTSDQHHAQAHAEDHVDGTDDIQNATAAQKGVATAAQITKLDAIEALADVTDATNVDAAGAVMEADFDAQTVLAATSDDTPAALTVDEQRVVGRLTGGNVDGIAVGIVDNNMVQVDGSPADNEFAKWTGEGLEGRTYAEVLADLSGEAGAAFDWNNKQLTSMVVHVVNTIGEMMALSRVKGKLVFRNDDDHLWLCIAT